MINGLKTKVCDRHMDFEVHYWDFLIRCPICEWDEGDRESYIKALNEEIGDSENNVFDLEQQVVCVETRLARLQEKADVLESKCREMERLGMKRFFIEISDLRTTVCYNYGCNRWYLCLKHKGDDSHMKDCEGYKKESNASYREFRID